MYESGNLYRLQYVIPTDKGELKEYSSWIYVTNVSGFAPEIIDGETIRELESEIRIKDRDYIYVIQKNAEKFEFLDIRDINNEPSPSDNTILLNSKYLKEYSKMKEK